jgi:hypothetical protein
LPSASIYISKIAAAGRQLDAAIRMFFDKEDDLAIHTVASASFRILRDVTEKRGKNFTSEVLRNGIYVMARQYAEGQLPEEKLKLIQDTPLMPVIKMIAAQGENFDISRIHVPMTKSQEQRAWPSKAANFLKHADRDSLNHLLEGEIKNENVLIGACVAYLELIKEPTPEITAFVAFWAARNDANLDGDCQVLSSSLKSVAEHERYRLCARFIRDEKKLWS